ncbi:sulfite exporter TauE/SafE family protein [Streptomyces sp. NPDC054765]
MSVLIAAAALPCGLLIGLLLGALGGGGSVLAVPALVYLLGQSPHEATAGALIVVTVGAVTGLVCHARAGRVRWAAGAVFGVLGTAGSYLGSRWSAALDPAMLMAAFAGLLLVVAAMLVVRGLREWRVAARGGGPLREAAGSVSLEEPTGSASLGDSAGDSAGGPAGLFSAGDSAEASPGDSIGAVPLRDLVKPVALRDPAQTAPTAPTAQSSLPAQPAQPARRVRSARPTRPTRPLRFAMTASAVGLLTGFFGVGGGFVVVPALTLVLGLEMPVAIGTSLLVILINSLTALGTRAGTGALDWPLLAGFAACAAVGSHLGNRLTTRLRPQTLTTAFACLVTVLAICMAATALPRLWAP